ncbi:cobalamin-dependent protein [Micromonospora sp. NPDC005979]|uniref:cobalamin B12-binding domain-containing protein n=1 Tax=Micromonospora sp. NPDC005979 TaxID=3156726 RepID=UPI0033BFB237
MMPRRSSGHCRVLLSSVSSDSHTWNLVYLQLLLEEAGHQVTNLGACVPDDLLVETAARWRPSVIVISSVNGHGHLDGARLIGRVRADARIRHIPAVIGGKLGIAGDDRPYVERLAAAGFDLVFPQGSDVTELPGLVEALSVQTGDRESARAA